MSQTTVMAMRYARALAEHSNAIGQFAAVRDDLLLLRDLLDPDSGDFHAPELLDFLSSPVIPPEKKNEVMGRICEGAGIGPVVREFLRVLIGRRHCRILLHVMRAYDDAARKVTGEYTVRVEAARPLTEEQRRRIAEALEKAMKTKVNLLTGVAGRLMAGMRLRIGSRMLDSTARGKLHRLRDTLQQTK